MPTYVKNGGVQRRALSILVKSGGVWRKVRRAYIKSGGTWRLVFGTAVTTSSFLTAGIHSFTVPDGVYSLTMQASGAGGGAGGGDVGGDSNNTGGGGGGGSNLISATIDVIPGDVITINIPAGGAGAPGGGTGANGGTTTITRNGVVVLSAAGGTGGKRGENGGHGFCGLGANGANWGSSFRTYQAGTSTNGGSDGGAGVPHFQSTGGSGQPGKAIFTY
jgi:hypothetical protein